MIPAFLIAAAVTGATVEQWEHWTHMGCVSGLALDGSTLIAATSGGIAFGTLSGVELAWDSVWVYPGRLSHSDVRTVVIDSEGTLWAGTWGGGIDAWQEDGDYVHYGQLEGLPVGQQVSCILPDTSVFAGTSQGLAIREYGYFQTWTEISTGGGLTADNVTALFGSDSGLFVGTSSGLSMLRAGELPGGAGSWASFPEMDGHSIRALARTADTLWAATETGLWFLAPGASWRMHPGYPGESPVCLSVLGDILVAGDGEVVYRYSDGEWSSWTVAVGQLVRSVAVIDWHWVCAGLNNLLSDQRDTGYGVGVGWFDGWSISRPDGLPGNDLRSVSVGSGGECWISTNHSGAAVLDGGVWTVFESQLPNSHQVFAIEADPDGGVYIAPYHYGLAWLDWAGTPSYADDRMVAFDKAGSGLLNDQVNEISLAADGSVWLAHEPFYEEPGEASGASRLVWQPGDSTSSVWSEWTPEDGLPSGFAFAAAPSGGEAWIGTKSGLALVGPGSGEIQMVLTTSDGLPSNDVEALLMTRSGVLYAGTTGGLATVAPGAASASQVTGVDDAVGALCADNLGGIWAAGSDALYRIAPDGSVESYNRYNSPLLSTAVNGMDCDFDAGTVYLATDHGCWAMHLGQGMAGDGSGATVFPNPFLPGDGQVLGVAGIQDLPTSIRVFDLSGRLVYESAFPGRDEIAWDGMDSGGSPASAGIYMVEVVQQDTAVRLKLALVR